MNRRVAAVVVAVVLALLGSVLLISYVNGAEERAMAELDPVSVLVATRPIAKGTPADSLGELVETKELPSAAAGPAAVTELWELGSKVAVTDLQPGEQVLAGRFASRQSLVEFGGIPAPKGFHQVTIPLDSPRLVGGTVTPGDTVGVFISLGGTHLTLHKVFVIRVQGGLTPAPPTEGGADDPAAAPMPEGGAMVTLALTAPDAEKVVFGAEHGSIWLSLEDAATPEDGTRIVDPGNVYE